MSDLIVKSTRMGSRVFEPGMSITFRYSIARANRIRTFAHVRLTLPNRSVCSFKIHRILLRVALTPPVCCPLWIRDRVKIVETSEMLTTRASRFSTILRLLSCFWALRELLLVDFSSVSPPLRLPFPCSGTECVTVATFFDVHFWFDFPVFPSGPYYFRYTRTYVKR